MTSFYQVRKVSIHTNYQISAPYFNYLQKVTLANHRVINALPLISLITVFSYATALRNTSRVLRFPFFRPLPSPPKKHHET